MTRVLGRPVQSRKKSASKSKKKVNLKLKKAVSITAKPKKKPAAPKVRKGTRWEEYRHDRLIRVVEVIGFQIMNGERRALCKVTFNDSPSVKARGEVKIASRRLQERFKIVE